MMPWTVNALQVKVRLSLKGNAGGWKESKESKKIKEPSVQEVKKKKDHGILAC
jgi:hypothetical protein